MCFWIQQPSLGVNKRKYLDCDCYILQSYRFLKLFLLFPSLQHWQTVCSVIAFYCSIALKIVLAFLLLCTCTSSWEWNILPVMQCINLALIGISRFPDLIFTCVVLFFKSVFEGTSRLSNRVQLSVKIIQNNLRFFLESSLTITAHFKEFCTGEQFIISTCSKMFFPFFFSG